MGAPRRPRRGDFLRWTFRPVVGPAYHAYFEVRDVLSRGGLVVRNVLDKWDTQELPASEPILPFLPRLRLNDGAWTGPFREVPENTSPGCRKTLA